MKVARRKAARHVDRRMSPYRRLLGGLDGILQPFKPFKAGSHALPSLFRAPRTVLDVL